ncbi:MAG: tyrosine-type recombinase/integrase [Oscillospiraceae bacterium]|nr:tyrosine-type recombinase/integrase [Oscillospiraceae bacterium]MCL2279447.1 tyrosine-type recombinase/integrase [Oscillospiraceae bacterium]
MKHYAQLLTTEPGPESSGKPFTEAEIAKLWKDCEQYGTDAILMLIYTGFRIREFFALKLADISLAEGTVIGGSKTAAGRNRVVPIHAKIRHIVKRCVESNREYLVERSGEQWDYHSFIYNVWAPIMSTLAAQHTPHDTRHTFRTRLDNAGANKRCIDLLMGHKSADIGERVYTHKTLDDLREALALVKH